MKKKILFVCIGNSCRSQMAEGFTNQLHADALEAYSAGIRPSKIDQLAVEVMKEKDIDLSGSPAKTIDSLSEIEFDYVVTVCDSGAEDCPYIPARSGIIHMGFPDPPRLTAEIKQREERLPVYREVRDAIERFIQELPDRLE